MPPLDIALRSLSMDPEHHAVPTHTGPVADDLAAVSVFPLIPALKKDVLVSTASVPVRLVCTSADRPQERDRFAGPLLSCIQHSSSSPTDSALSWECVPAFRFQLYALSYSPSQSVCPLVNRYARLRNMSVVYVCLVVHSYFLAQAETDLAFSSVMIACASLCEIPVPLPLK